MAVKIIVAFSILLLGLFLATRKFKLFRIIGFLLILLWLFIGDWGGLELLKKLFIWISHGHLLHFIEIIIGFFVAVWLFSKLLPSGGGSQKGSSFKDAASVKSEPQSGKEKWVVNGKEFDTLVEAQLYNQGLNKPVNIIKK